MGITAKTGCVLCAQNCGLEVEVENNRITKVRGDKENVRSQGYVCRKGLNIAYHQHHADRLKTPLKRVGDRFEPIAWDQAIGEIAERLKKIIDQYGPRSFAYMGGGGQGCHFEAAFGVRLLRGLGSHFHYSAVAQEFSGMFWVHGRMFGRQYLHGGPDIEETDLLLIMGWNGMQSHQIPQAPRHLLRLAKDPHKLLVVVDPRRSETAQIANLHLPIRPGTDALLLRAMIAIILQEGWEKKDYLAQNTTGWEKVKDLFLNFDIQGALRTCRLDYTQIYELCRRFATEKSTLRYDLGVMMNRHSASSSYLAMVLLAICGRIGVPGGFIFPGHIMPMGVHSDERNPKTWRTSATNFFPVLGTFPPNAMPEEILNEGPDRLRAVLVSASNPLRSYADTTAYEKAFKHLDLLVTVDLAMTETAVLSHYILPARSGYESWDSTFFSLSYPGIYFQMRRPIIQPEGEPLEAGEIHLRLADRMGLIPPIPESLYQAAEKGRSAYGLALLDFIQKEPGAMKVMPFVLGKTLGKALGSVHLAALWGLLQTTPPAFQEQAVRSGFSAGFGLGEEIFQKIIDHPEGLWIGKVAPEKEGFHLHTEDKRINLFIPELMEPLKMIVAEKEERSLEPDPSFPLILMAGRHISVNANTLMRNPEWNKGRRACTCTMHPDDAEALGLSDGQPVRVSTDAGTVEVELEVTPNACKGQVVIPHGFGLIYQGKEYGVNVNRLTKNTNRDFLGTPMHRFVPCRVEGFIT
jgi:anaerobic selenocysteine-containing dehydrogenase